MECGAPISFESLLRQVVRFDAANPNCAAIKVTEGITNTVTDCGVEGLLTLYAKALIAGTAQIEFTQGDWEPTDCNDLPGLLTLAGLIIAYADEGTLIMTREPFILPDLDCDQQCDDSMMGTIERIMRTFVKVGSPSSGPYAVQVTHVTMTEEMPCDRTYSFKTLLNMVLAPVGDGTYTWRITDGIASPTEPSAIVSGAGTGEANGRYSANGTLVTGRLLFIKVGNSDIKMIWDGSAWVIFDITSDNLYFAVGDVPYPWDAVGWAVDGVGVGPAPTVTEG